MTRYPAPIPNATEITIVKSNASGTNRVVKSRYLLYKYSLHPVELSAGKPKPRAYNVKMLAQD